MVSPEKKVLNESGFVFHENRDSGKSASRIIAHVNDVQINENSTKTYQLFSLKI